MLIYFIVFLGYFSFLSRNRFFVFSSEFERDDGLLYCILQLLFIFIFPEKKRIYVMVNIYYYVPDVIIENGGSLCFNLPEKQ